MTGRVPVTGPSVHTVQGSKHFIARRSKTKFWTCRGPPTSKRSVRFVSDFGKCWLVARSSRWIVVFHWSPGGTLECPIHGWYRHGTNMVHGTARDAARAQSTIAVRKK